MKVVLGPEEAFEFDFGIESEQTTIVTGRCS